MNIILLDYRLLFFVSPFNELQMEVSMVRLVIFFLLFLVDKANLGKSL